MREREWAQRERKIIGAKRERGAEKIGDVWVL